MIQATIVLSLLGIGLVALITAHVRRSRRGSARTTPGHLRNVNGADPRNMRLHQGAAVELATKTLRTPRTGPRPGRTGRP